MKRIDLIIPHEHLIEVNKILYKHKAGGMTFYDIKGRGRYLSSLSNKNVICQYKA